MVASIRSDSILGQRFPRGSYINFKNKPLAQLAQYKHEHAWTSNFSREKCVQSPGNAIERVWQAFLFSKERLKKNDLSTVRIIYYSLLHIRTENFNSVRILCIEQECTSEDDKKS